MTDSRRPLRPTAVPVTGETTIGERIVVVDEGGPAGRAAVRWVAERLGRRPADVRVIGSVASAAADAVEVFRTVAPSASVVADVMAGDPDDSLVTAAETADLLVVGLNADDRGRHHALPERLAARASCVVVVVPEEWAPGGGVTVAGASLDAASDAAIEFAKDHARRERGGLRLVHAWELPVTGEVSFPETTADSSIPEVQRHALEAFAAGVRSAGLEVTSAAQQGSPVEVLTAAAAGADLLVVGRRTRHPLTRLLLGSVSRSLVQDPPCPIAVVPQPRVPLRTTRDDPRDVVP